MTSLLQKILRFLALWIALPCGLVTLAFFLKAGMLAVCIYAFLLLLLAARAMMQVWAKPLHCDRDVSADVIRIGDPVSVVTRVKNHALWPILWVFAEETLPAKTAVEGMVKRLFFLPPARSGHLYYKLTPSQRGFHQIGPVVLETGDVFGLFKRCRVDRRRDFVTVLPRYHVIEEFRVGQRRNLGDFTAERSIFEDPTRLRGIRDYQRGDALKRIHWRASARMGRLCTKIFDPVVEPGATVVLDFHRDSWENARSTDPSATAPEMAVEIACSICRYLSDGGWKLGFFSNGRDPLGLPGITMAQVRVTESLGEALEAARQGRADNRLEPISIRGRTSPDQFNIIHENLGRITLSDGLPVETLIMEELPYIDRQQVLVFITGDISDSFVAGLAKLREMGYRVMLFVVCNPDAHDKAFEHLLPHGVEIFDMDWQGRMEEIATGRRTF